MTIGDEDVAIGRHGDSRWPVERIRSVPADAWRADRHQHLPVRADLQDLLAHRDALSVFRRHAEDRLFVVGIGRPDIAVLVDGESVRVRKESDAEALVVAAGRIELQDGRVVFAPIHAGGVAVGLIVEAAVKHPDVAVRRHVDADDLSPLASLRTLHPCGKRRPVRHEPIWIGQIGFGDPRLAPGACAPQSPPGTGRKEPRRKTERCCELVLSQGRPFCAGIYHGPERTIYDSSVP